MGLAFIGTLCSGHSVGVVQVRCSCKTCSICYFVSVLYAILLAGCNVSTQGIYMNQINVSARESATVVQSEMSQQLFDGLL